MNTFIINPSKLPSHEETYLHATFIPMMTLSLSKPIIKMKVTKKKKKSLTQIKKVIKGQICILTSLFNVNKINYKNVEM